MSNVIVNCSFVGNVRSLSHVARHCELEDPMKLTKQNGKFVIEGECQCDSCGGTGLYVGMAENNGAAVVCRDCDGTGKAHVRHEFREFTKRKMKKGVKRVYETAAGYGISAEDVITEKGKTIHFSRFGVAYKDWLNGKKPVPIEELHCPYEHTNQRLQTKDVNGLYKTRCSKYLGFRISNCKCRKEMKKCWDIYLGRQTRGGV